MTIVVIGRLPLGSLHSGTPGEGSAFKGQRVWDYEANSIHLNRTMPRSASAIIVCRAQTKPPEDASEEQKQQIAAADEAAYQALRAKVDAWNVTCQVLVIEAAPVVRASPTERLVLPDETFDKAILATPTARQASQRTWGEFAAQCVTPPKMPSLLGIYDALSSSANAVSQMLAALRNAVWPSKGYDGVATLEALDKQKVRPSITPVVAEPVQETASVWQRFCNWARGAKPVSELDKTKGMEVTCVTPAQACQKPVAANECMNRIVRQRRGSTPFETRALARCRKPH